MTTTDPVRVLPQTHYDTPPANVRALNQRLRNCLDTEDPSIEFRMRVTLANVVVGQMLPSGAVKGGTAMKLRLGHEASRFTPDLDTARRNVESSFVNELTQNLTEGWNGFTGRLVRRTPPRPPAVPTEYVMVPYEVKLDYMGKSWRTVTLELGHNEIGDADDPEFVLAADIIEWFDALGLPRPEPIAVMRVDHQIAQKIHACSAPDSERAHDLVDLQLLAATQELDLGQVRATTVRLFEYRKGHSWPPTITAGEEWPTIYREAAEGLPVAETVEGAVAWGNDFVRSIDSQQNP